MTDLDLPLTHQLFSQRKVLSGRGLADWAAALAAVCYSVAIPDRYIHRLGPLNSAGGWAQLNTGGQQT